MLRKPVQSTVNGVVGDLRPERVQRIKEHNSFLARFRFFEVVYKIILGLVCFPLRQFVQ